MGIQTTEYQPQKEGQARVIGRGLRVHVGIRTTDQPQTGPKTQGSLLPPPPELCGPCLLLNLLVAELQGLAICG